MDLMQSTVPERICYHAEGSFELANKKEMKLQTPGTPPVNLLVAAPPEGKKWQVSVIVNVVETEA